MRHWIRSQLGQRDQKGTQRASEFSGKIIRFVDNLSSIIGAFVEHNRYIFGAVQHSIIGRFSSIIRLPLSETVTFLYLSLVTLFQRSVWYKWAPKSSYNNYRFAAFLRCLRTATILVHAKNHLIPPFYPMCHTRDKIYQSHSYTHVGLGARLYTG